MPSMADGGSGAANEGGGGKAPSASTGAQLPPGAPPPPPPPTTTGLGAGGGPPPPFGPGGPVPSQPQQRCAQCGKGGVPLLACDDPEVLAKAAGPYPGQRPRFCDTCMIGKQVRVFWPVDESWYTGTVQKFDESTGEHLLEYPDGDTEWVKIGDAGQPHQQQPQPLPQQHPLHPGVGPPHPSHLPPHLGGGGPGGPHPPRPDPYLMGGGDYNGGGHLMGGGGEGGPGGDLHPGGPPYGGYPPPPPHGYPGGGGGGMPPYPGMPPHGVPPPYRMYPPPPYGGAGGMGGGPMYPGGPGGGGPNPMMMGGGGGGGPGDDKGDLHGGGGSSSGVGGNMDDPNSKRKSGPKAWTKEEDALLLNIVKKMQMPMKWSIVAQSLPDRTGKQCRERYVNHLNPRLKITDWNALEDSTIFHLYNSLGSHWAKMSKIIPGRTDNGIKNRFHNLRRQFEREDEHRLRLSSTNEFKDAIRLDRLRKFPPHMEGQVAKLWDMHSGIGILAAQSVMGGGIGRTKNRFGPFRRAETGGSSGGIACVRCGLMVPSLQTGDEVCEKTGWCQSCTRIPPHISANLLRECLNLRREQNLERREIVESWEEYFQKDGRGSGDDNDEDEDNDEDDNGGGEDGKVPNAKTAGSVKKEAKASVGSD